MKRLMFGKINLAFFSFIVAFRIIQATENGADIDVVEHKWKDVALNRETKQKSTFDESSLSEFGVDGNVTTCSRTAQEKESEWTVYFGQPRVIAQLRINTGSVFFGSNFEIFIGGNDSSVRSLCSLGRTSEVMPVYVLSCYGGPMLGHSLTIFNRYSSGVQLCDVQLMECEDGYFGLNCTLQCHCGNDSICDKSSGLCPDHCAAGFNGTSCQDECDAGTFGVGCVMNCHCASDVPCNVSTGTCPTGCASGWLGQTCQTVFPQISAAPSFKSARETLIVIRWNQWTSEIEAPFTLFYLVEYKQVTMSQNDTVWMQGELVQHTPMSKDREAQVSGLRRNTFYDFRVTPLLQTVEGRWINGTSSQRNSSFRTKCSVPEMPVIKSVEAFIMTSHRHESIPAIGVEWTLLTDEESNCERIRNYEIFYQKHGSITWDRVSVSNSIAARNVTENIEFAVEYWVMLTAYNNQPLESSSKRMRVVTPFAPSTLPPTIVDEGTRDAGIIAGAVVCAAIFIALILGIFLYRWKMSGKHKPAPGHATVVYSPVTEPA